MTRSLFFAFFVRLAMAMALVVLLRVWVIPKGWVLGTLFVLGWASLSAFFLSRSVRKSVASLQVSAAAMAEHPSAAVAQRFSDFDGLARAISHASAEVERSLHMAQASRRELEAMIDSMQDAVVAVDPALRIQWSNQRMERLMLGAPVSSPVRVGHRLVQTVRDPDVLECVRLAIEHRTVNERRSTSVVPGRIFEVSASPMPGGGAVAVLHDITRIEQVERTQRDFVANVSHELRTPLTSISGYVETLLDHETGLTPTAREFLGTILKNASRMNRLTEDLLLMARAESAEQKLRIAPVAAATLLRDAVQLMSALVQDAGALVEIGESSSAEVLADTDATLQVLSNLIENAVKYGRGGPRQPARVIVAAREVAEPTPAVEFSVRDFGPGIASEHLHRIFERFYRVDKARSRESGGTGLGLAIARRIVEAQGGSIRAESDLNAGSTFLFTLPLSGRPAPEMGVADVRSAT